MMLQEQVWNGHLHHFRPLHSTSRPSSEQCGSDAAGPPRRFSGQTPRIGDDVADSLPWQCAEAYDQGRQFTRHIGCKGSSDQWCGWQPVPWWWHRWGALIGPTPAGDPAADRAQMLAPCAEGRVSLPRLRKRGVRCVPRRLAPTPSRFRAVASGNTGTRERQCQPAARCRPSRWRLLAGRCWISTAMRAVSRGDGPPSTAHR